MHAHLYIGPVTDGNRKRAELARRQAVEQRNSLLFSQLGWLLYNYAAAK